LRVRASLPDDFFFIAGNRMCSLPKFQAMLLSPLADQLIALDPTIDRFTIPRVPDIDAELFEGLIGFASGRPLAVSESTVESFYPLSESLGNAELSRLILDFEFGREPLSLSNAVHRMVAKRRLGAGCSNQEGIKSRLLRNDVEQFFRNATHPGHHSFISISVILLHAAALIFGWFLLNVEESLDFALIAKIIR
jgi:hypothetical protein